MRDWLADRRGLLLGLALGLLALLASLRLSPGWGTGMVSLGDLGYGALLGGTALTLGLLLDWRRHRRLGRRLAALEPQADESLESLFGRCAPAREAEARFGLEAGLERALAGLAAVAKAERASLETERRNRDDDHASLVHEAKTPVAALSLALEKRERELNLSDSELDLLRAARREIGRLELILERGLFTSRAESFAADFLLEETDLRRLAAAVAARFAPAFLDRRLAFSLAPETCRVLTDPKWLSFILSQLFSNALKYVPPGGAVAVRCRAGLREACLEIEDNGPGIATEDLPRLFERGYTGHARRTVHSTGMGLYLARRLALRLGHELEAGNVATGGARFTLRFPAT